MPVRALERPVSLPIDSVISVVVGSVTSVVLLTPNTARIMAVIYNDSAARLFVKYRPLDSSTGVSLTDFTTMIGPGQSAPIGYAGRVDGIWDEAVGSARITELL